MEAERRDSLLGGHGALSAGENFLCRWVSALLLLHVALLERIDTYQAEVSHFAHQLTPSPDCVMKAKNQ